MLLPSLSPASLFAVLGSGMVMIKATMAQPGGRFRGNAGGFGGGFGGGATAATAVDGVYGASIRGAIGTTVTTGDNAGQIYGPFDAGFQAGFIRDCPGHPAIDAGTDTKLAVDFLRSICPDVPQNPILNDCGGHAQPFHYHEFLTCLYTGGAAGHSTRAADITHPDGTQGLYGKYESTGMLPREAGNPLDACNGHFGVTPDSNGEVVYHYHVTDAAPFTVGCLGPAVGNQLVTVAQCRAASPSCDGVTNTYDVLYFGESDIKSVEYDNDCSCFDANGSNVGNVELDLSAGNAPTPADPADDVADPVPAPTPAPAPPAANPSDDATAPGGAQSGPGGAQQQGPGGAQQQGPGGAQQQGPGGAQPGRRPERPAPGQSARGMGNRGMGNRGRGGRPRREITIRGRSTNV